MSKTKTPKYDVFLSHNAKNKAITVEVKQLLSESDYAAWLDVDELIPGGDWQQGIEAGILDSRSVAVLVGKDGLGPWEDLEMRAALTLAVENNRPVIPVLLPGARKKPRLPIFLSGRTWVDLRGGLTTEAMGKLVWGIRGSRLQSKKQHRRQLPIGRPKVEGGTIFAIGSGNLENLLVCKGRVALGEKHEVSIDSFWGGSAVNFSSRLLSAGFPVVPILAIGNDAAGRSIRDALHRSSISGKAAQHIQEHARGGDFLMKDVQTPTSTIVVCGRERTIFRPKLLASPTFNKGFKSRVRAVLAKFSAKPASVILGHIPTEGKETTSPGECTQFVLRNCPDHTLIYAVFGGTQLALPYAFWESDLSRIDVFQCNMEEAVRFFGADHKKATLRSILELFRKRRMAAVLTMDRFGAVAICNGGDAMSIAWPLVQGEEVVDSTGAGDAFAAGMMSILHANSRGRRISETQFDRALHEGAIWAAAACTVFGGCGRDPKTDLERFRHEHPGIEQKLPDRRQFENAQEILNFIDLAYR
jgi:sugar/nucleoside kinase (ribokinase family)